MASLQTRFYVDRTTGASMSQNSFPNGCDEDRVRRVIAHYGEQTEDEALRQDEAIGTPFGAPRQGRSRAIF
jgi:hypothetical protein